MIFATLRRIESTHENLRTDEIVGVASTTPEVGQMFMLYAAPLTQGARIRVVTTTPVRSLETVGEVHRFVTRNSTYELTVHLNSGRNLQ